MATQAEQFIKQVLAEREPDLDLSENTPFYDLFVRFVSNTSLAEIVSLRDSIEESRSISNVDMGIEEFDALLNNWFFTRNQGLNTFITVRLFFSSPLEVSIPLSQTFTINNTKFKALYSQSVRQNDFILSPQGEYSIDINLTSVDIGASTSVGVDTDVSTSFNIGSGFLRGVVVSVSQTGADMETNQQAHSRLQSELGHRALTSSRSIKARLSEVFPGVVSSVFTAGFAEPEMVRDAVSVEIPKRVVRLVFTEPIALNLKKETTEFFYNNDQNSLYRLRADFIETENSGLWEAKNNLFYIEIEIELDDYSTASGFKEDMQITVPSLTNNPRFVTAVTKTTFNGVGVVRVGGKTDVYIKVPTERRTITMNVPTNFTGLLPVPDEIKPVLKINGATTITNGISTDLQIYSLFSRRADLRFSGRDETDFYIDPAAAGSTLKIDVTCAPFVRRIDSFLNEKEERSISDDKMAKFFHPVFTEVYAVISTGDSDPADLKAAVTEYVNNITPGDSFVVSKLIEKMHGAVDSLSAMYIDTIQVYTEQHMPNGEIFTSFETDIINSVEDLDQGVSRRNTMFVLDNIDFIII